MKICLIISASLALIFLISTIVLCVKLIKNKPESRIYNSLIPSNEEEE